MDSKTVDPLKIIQEKEQELEDRIRETNIQAIKIAMEAERQAEAFLVSARRTARERVELLHKGLLSAVSNEIDGSTIILDCAELRQKGEQNIPQAVQYIIELVTARR